MGCVYIAMNRLNGKSYIGMTTQKFRIRQLGHRLVARKNPNRFVFTRAIAKYGWDAFRWEILYESSSIEELRAKERELIALCNTHIYGYNCTLGGEGVLLTEEQRIAKSQQVSQWYVEGGEYVRKRKTGIEAFYTEEKRQELSQKMKDRYENDPEWREFWLERNRATFTPERRQQCADIMRKRWERIKQEDPDWSKRRASKRPPLTEEQRLARSAKHKQYCEEHPEYVQAMIARNKAQATDPEWLEKTRAASAKRKIPIICVDTGVEYLSAKDAADILGIRRRDIVSVLRGKQRTVRGMRFIYKDREHIHE